MIPIFGSYSLMVILIENNCRNDFRYRPRINMSFCIGWGKMVFGVFLLLLFEFVPK